MYTIYPETGCVIRDSDNVVVAPTGNIFNPNYQEYIQWLAANTDNKPTVFTLTEAQIAFKVKTENQKYMWEEIKKEREKRKFAGVKVGTNWFHSDPDSRSQQLGLVIIGQNLPPNTPWKLLVKNADFRNPTYTIMTPTLAIQIFQATMLSDMNIHKSADDHMNLMVQLENPLEYDFSGNWPVSFLDP